jgi:glyoxylase-like metal-dependent hydrolase (beta-lactamase superfamily II)
MQQITPDVYTFTGLTVGRVYLIHDPDGLTIIDTSIPNAGPKMLDQIAAQGWSADQVRRILITHAHPDHIGALAYLQAHTQAKVYASAPEREVIEGRALVLRPTRDQLRGPARLLVIPMQPASRSGSVDETIQEGTIIPALGGLQVLGAPGHAPGQIAFWQPEQRILFCGDAMMNIFGGLRLPIPMFTPDMDEAIRSIGKLARLDIAITCFGHGLPLVGVEPIRAFAGRVSVQA